MTLQEAEKATGVPADYLIEKLSLPPDFNKDECLGELRKMYGFTIDDVRQIIREYQDNH